MVVEVSSNAKLAFGKRIREVRQAKRFSQKALAARCELDRTYIGSVEREERNISLVNIHRLAAALDVSPKVLFD